MNVVESLYIMYIYMCVCVRIDVYIYIDTYIKYTNIIITFNQITYGTIVQDALVCLSPPLRLHPA